VLNESRIRTITEFAGAVSIVLSLIFVGMEVRQNTAAIRTSTVQAIADQDTTINLAFATDDELARLLTKAYLDSGATQTDTGNMSVAEEVRLGMAIRAALRRVENIYLHVQAGVLEPEALDRVGYGFYTVDFMREYWNRARAGYDQDFAEFFDAKLAHRSRTPASD
jgi:hypothetical protein